MLFRTSTFAGLAVVVLAAADLPAQPHVVHSQNAEPRDHHLFVGAELFVQQEGKLIPVRNIRGNNVLIESPEPDYHPLHRTSGITYHMATKVSATVAEIKGYTAEKSYSPMNNPLAEQARLQIFIDQQSDMIEADQSRKTSQASAASTLAQTGDTPEIRAEAAATEQVLLGEIADLSDGLASLESINESTTWDLDLLGDYDDENLDAVEISFKLSADKEIAHAYVFAIIRVRINEQFRDDSFHRHIGRVTTRPRRVTLTQDGYPPGFEIKETKVYLYSHGEEIPTNHSEKHYELTYAEAREFVKLSHLSEHRKESAPAAPAWSLAPAALLKARNNRLFAYPIQVNLDAEGQVLGVQEENQIVPDHVRDLLQEITFLPAVENGQPVPSTITLNPADFYKEI